MKPIFTSKSVDNERLEHIEKTIMQLVRRSKKHVKAVITPFPISSATFSEDVKGDVLCYMFPCEGTVTKGIVSIDNAKANYTLTIAVQTSEGNEIKSFNISKKHLEVTPNIKVPAGSKLTISISNLSEEVIKELWISFLWIPTISNTEVKSYLYDEIEESNERV